MHFKGIYISTYHSICNEKPKIIDIDVTKYSTGEAFTLTTTRNKFDKIRDIFQNRINSVLSVPPSSMPRQFKLQHTPYKTTIPTSRYKDKVLSEVGLTRRLLYYLTARHTADMDLLWLNT